MTNRSKIRVLVAKPGLDGHDRGAKVVAHALKEAGMEVIYTGLHQSVESIVQAAVQEDVDVVGLSVMTGGHLPLCRKLMKLLEQKGATGKLICVGGVIPTRDFEALKALGIQGIFPGGTPLEETIEFIKAAVSS
ncbi:MAG: cobalamin B12-binding domain-containing protein [Deltaproteobacteria bacterium]|nr:cobalamin B12-binding domain-containing protein [Deltaproteobacteria bacterium]